MLFMRSINHRYHVRFCTREFIFLNRSRRRVNRQVNTRIRKRRITFVLCMINISELWCEAAEAFSSVMQFADYWRNGLCWWHQGTQEHAASAHAWRERTVRVVEANSEGTQSDGKFLCVETCFILTLCHFPTELPSLRNVGNCNPTDTALHLTRL
jgi:hypothetical protein